METVSDRLTDKYLGEYERPNHLHKGRIIGQCWSCGQDVYAGDDVHYFDIDNDGSDELVCDECAHRNDILDAVFMEKSIAEKLELLEAV